MKSFFLPADFKAETVDAYAALNAKYDDSKVVGTYGNITVKNCFGSGRNADKLPKVGLEELRSYVEYSQRHNIDFSYTLNPSFMENREFTPEGIKEIRSFLGKLRGVGIRSIIVALPSLMEVVKASGHDFRIKASAICQITSANKALYWKQMGADAMVIDETINRDFANLRRIRKAFGEDVQVIVNSICHQDCQYRMFHYNQISEDSVSESNPISCAYFQLRCAQRLYGDLSNYFKTTWIRPEDLKHYIAAGITHFKLQGRQSVLTGDPVRAVECYFNEHYEGDLKELLFMFAPSDKFQLSVDNASLEDFLKPFVENEDFCKRDCTGCDYCEAYAKQLFNSSATEVVREKAMAVMAEKDPYRKIIKS